MSTIATPRARTRRGGARRTSGLGALGRASAFVVALAALLAALGPALAPHDPNAGTLSDAFVGPVAGHPLGFDGQGRDLLSRLLVGARTSLIGALCVVAAALAIGTGLAVVGAWYRGRVDTVVSAVLDLLFSFPAILIAVLAATMFGAGLIAASVALAIAYAPYIARVVRSAVLRERSQEYVAALEVLGVSSFRICVRHLLPNVLPLIVAQSAILFGFAVVDLAIVSFLGLGVQQPQADWGVMVASGQAGVLQGYPAESLSAGLCIVVVVVAVNVLGERLSDRAEGRER